MGWKFLSHPHNPVSDLELLSRQAERLQELWAEHHQQTPEGEAPRSSISPPQFIEASLSEGWTLTPAPFTPAPLHPAAHLTPAPLHLAPLHLITDSEIFGWERPQPRQRPSPLAETPETAYADLHPGDWVVHVDYGVGRYTGLVRRTLEGLAREFLCVE